jgi:hypothetical protein
LLSLKLQAVIFQIQLAFLPNTEKMVRWLFHSSLLLALCTSSTFAGQLIADSSKLSYGSCVPLNLAGLEDQNAKNQLEDGSILDQTLLSTQVNSTAVFPVVEDRNRSIFQVTETKCIQGKEDGIEKHCVYTIPSFAKNRGISIISSPATAEEIFQLPAFTDSTLYDEPNNDAYPSFFAIPIPGRGIGLVANRTMYRGDLIYSNFPALLVDVRLEDIYPDEFLSLQQLAVESLPDETQNLFMNLATDPKDDKVNGIIRTNSFGGTIPKKPQNSTFSLVIPEASVSYSFHVERN